MKFEDLKVGMKVYIREDLVEGEYYSDYLFADGMLKGIGVVSCLFNGKYLEHVTLKGNNYNYSYGMIDWEKTAELNGFKANDVFIDVEDTATTHTHESDHIALIENRGGVCKYEEVMTCHAQIMKSFKDKHISDVRLATMSMIAHKIARLVCGYGDDDDNLKDIAGYAELERMTLKGNLK